MEDLSLEPNVSFLSLLMAPDNSPEDDNQNFSNILQTPTYNSTPFVSSPHPMCLPPTPPPPFCSDGCELCGTLPDLDNIPEEVNQTTPPPVKDDYSLDSIVENYLKYCSKEMPKKNKEKRKRSTLGEKVYSLGKLLPGVQMKRKSTVEVLEEAHRYVKFLEAQVKALRSMPTQSSFTAISGGACGGALSKLNRQQVLEVVVNSAAAQMVMAENGWCLVSAEQVAFMKRVEARNKIVQRVLDTIPF